MTMNLISIGVDQSTTKTGLCAIRFGGKGFNYEAVGAQTVETPTKQAMEIFLIDFSERKGLKVITAEWGYVGKNVESAFSTIRTATWVEMIAYYHRPLTMFCTASALIWRNLAWGKGKGSMSRKAAKEFAIHFAKNVGIINPDDHQGDALGLAIYGMYKYLETNQEELIKLTQEVEKNGGQQ